MPKFIKITYMLQGEEFDLLVNVNDIARLSYGFCAIEFRTPLGNGLRLLSLSEKEFDRVEKILRGKENDTEV